jgi:multiple sugar transport system permease protein
MNPLERFLKRKEHLIFILPMVLYVGVMSVFPVAKSFQLSLTDKDLLSREAGDFIFLENYQILMEQPVFWQVLGNTAVFVLGSVALQFLLGFGLALLLKKNLPTTAVIRSILLLTWVVPGIITGFTWQWIFQSERYGLFNFLLISIGLPPVGWLYGPTSAMIALLIGNVWRGVSFHMIVQLAGLQTISDELYEAAYVDGASRVQSFLRVTLPLMRFSILISWIYGSILTFGVFDIVETLTGGGPGRTTETLSLYIYHTSFRQYRMGRGASLSVIMFLINLGLTLFYISLLRRTGDR